MKYTNDELKSFINKYIRLVSKKTNNCIKVNTFKMKKEELENIVMEHLYYSECQTIEEYESHICKYCGQFKNDDDVDLLCDECMELFGHNYFSEL